MRRVFGTKYPQDYLYRCQVQLISKRCYYHNPDMPAKNLHKIQPNLPNKNSLTFIVGDKGLGKSYFIHKYYKDEKNILYIKDQLFKSYFLEPIINAMSQFDYSFKIEHDDLNMPHTIRKILLDICRRYKCMSIKEQIRISPL